MSDGTSLAGNYQLSDGAIVDADNKQTPVSMDVYYIVPDKRTECVGFHDEPHCAAVCPVDCYVDDPDVRETRDELFVKRTNCTCSIS